MTEPRNQRALAWLLLGALAAGLAVTAYWLLFTRFQTYDDEGYVLISLRNFSLHGALYDRVYTQYGPVPYLLYDALHRLLGFAFNNTSGRWITLVNWLGTAAVCAALVRRVTRSTLWTAFTFAGTFTYLWVMINEPGHPGSLIAILVALGTWLGAELWTAGRFRRFALVMGVVAALLALTKINVGVFFAGAVFVWLALNTTPVSGARFLTWLAAAGCAVLPLVLMHTLIAEPRVRLFALVFACGLLATLVSARGTPRPVVTIRVWLWFGAALAGVLVLGGALTILRGTSLHGLIDGILLAPLRQPVVYSFTVDWRTGTKVLALASLALAAWATRANWLGTPRFREFVAWARLLVTIIFLCCPLYVISTSMATLCMCYGITLAWLFALPLREEPSGGAVRTWVALMLGFQCLHAYPVAGSQLNWGTFLWVPLLVLGLHDAFPILATRFGQRARLAGLLGRTLIAGITLFMTGELARIGWGWYSTSQPLGLTGAENVRLPNDLTYALRIICENLRTHADMLFSFPGTFSPNLWTGLPTPTLANATHWFSLLPDREQEAIIKRLAATPDAALLVQRDGVDYLAHYRISVRSPLHTWLMAHFEKVFALDDYEVWLRRGRTIAVLSTARVTVEKPPAGSILTLTLRAPAAPVASIQLYDVGGSPPLMTLNAQSTTATITPCGLDGRPTGPATPASFPLALKGIDQVTLSLPPRRMGVSWSQILIVLRDPKGSAIAKLLVAE